MGAVEDDVGFNCLGDPGLLVTAARRGGEGRGGGAKLSGSALPVPLV